MSNEITAYFKGRIGVAESVYQYDYGRVLVIDGLELPSVFEVHFELPGEDDAIIVVGQDNRVAIPNACLEATGIVTAYIYTHEGQNDGETEYIIRFNVMHRARPVDDGTEEEQSFMSEAIALMQHVSITGAVEAWLDEHPEATTTVQDNSITAEKLTSDLRKKINNEYVTPEMFGAVGDGNTDDTSAIQQALDSRGTVIFDARKTYRVTAPLRVSDHTFIELNGSTINSEYKHLFFNFLDTDAFADYDGNGDIIIRNGTIYGGGISFWHCENVLIENIHFKNCLNDHWFELCACKDFTIQNCSFVGMKYHENSIHEYINIDPCTTEVSTYFTGNSYPSGNYDGTRNLNIYIKNNYFDINTETGLEFDFSAMDNAFGCHTPIGNYHKNIQFVGNTVLNFKKLALRLSDMDSCLVKNNYIKSAINTETAIVMTKTDDMTYSNIDCRFENNYFAPNKWGMLIRDTLRFTAVGNVYDNQDNDNHTLGTIGVNNKQLHLAGNFKQGNSSPSHWSIDSTDYTSGDNPFDVIEMCNTAISKNGQVITNTKQKWTNFDRLLFKFSDLNRSYIVDAPLTETFRENVNYAISIDEATKTMLIYFVITSGSPNVLTIMYGTGVSSRTPSYIYAAKRGASNIART